MNFHASPSGEGDSQPAPMYVCKSHQVDASHPAVGGPTPSPSCPLEDDSRLRLRKSIETKSSNKTPTSSRESQQASISQKSKQASRETRKPQSDSVIDGQVRKTNPAPILEVSGPLKAELRKSTSSFASRNHSMVSADVSSRGTPIDARTLVRSEKGSSGCSNSTSSSSVRQTSESMPSAAAPASLLASAAAHADKPLSQMDSMVAEILRRSSAMAHESPASTQKQPSRMESKVAENRSSRQTKDSAAGRKQDDAAIGVEAEIAARQAEKELLELLDAEKRVATRKDKQKIAAPTNASKSACQGSQKSPKRASVATASIAEACVSENGTQHAEPAEIRAQAKDEAERASAPPSKRTTNRRAKGSKQAASSEVAAARSEKVASSTAHSLEQILDAVAQSNALNSRHAGRSAQGCLAAGGDKEHVHPRPDKAMKMSSTSSLGSTTAPSPPHSLEDSSDCATEDRDPFDAHPEQHSALDVADVAEDESPPLTGKSSVDCYELGSVLAPSDALAWLRDDLGKDWSSHSTQPPRFAYAEGSSSAMESRSYSAAQHELVEDLRKTFPCADIRIEPIRKHVSFHGTDPHPETSDPIDSPSHDYSSRSEACVALGEFRHTAPMKGPPGLSSFFSCRDDPSENGLSVRDEHLPPVPAHAPSVTQVETATRAARWRAELRQQGQQSLADSGVAPLPSPIRKKVEIHDVRKLEEAFAAESRQNVFAQHMAAFSGELGDRGHWQDGSRLLGADAAAYAMSQLDGLPVGLPPLGSQAAGPPPPGLMCGGSAEAWSACEAGICPFPPPIIDYGTPPNELPPPPPFAPPISLAGAATALPAAAVPPDMPFPAAESMSEMQLAEAMDQMQRTYSLQYQAAYREMYQGFLSARLQAAAPDHYED